ncbi:MAG: hypothetical protein R3323_11020, partial [Wenzhouxiangellaceae bacterium]|nr:hypothetical protein [Wenzhouxiangellaceae bacterium]
MRPNRSNRSNRSELSIHAALLAASIFLLLPLAAGAQTLVYERDFTIVDGADSVLRIELSADGRVTVQRPAFMTRPGHHEGQADP